MSHDSWGNPSLSFSLYLSLSLSFPLSLSQTFMTNIQTRGGVKVDNTVVKLNATTYKVVLSGVKISDAGEYVMYHEIAQHTLNCTTFLSVPGNYNTIVI